MANYTEIGKALRKIRIDHSEILNDMALKLNVSSAYLSAVENGKRPMPDAWVYNLKNLYELSEAQTDALISASDVSRKTASIDLTRLSPEKRQAAMRIARSFENIDEEKMKTMMNVIFSTKKE